MSFVLARAINKEIVEAKVGFLAPAINKKIVETEVDFLTWNNC